MPLQNRVTPFGNLISVPDRGTYTGNRGILHDADQRIVRYNVGRRWITCQLEFRGWHRAVMQPNRWTELFFLDESTALAAGHRPCAMCRYLHYQRFRRCWAEGHGEDLTSAEQIDRRMHEDRLAGARTKRTHLAPIESLPEGVFILRDDEPWLIWESGLHRWRPGGYDQQTLRPKSGDVTVLTPRCTVRTIAAGYLPVVHF